MNKGFLSLTAVIIIGLVSSLLVGGGAVLYNTTKTEKISEETNLSLVVENEDLDIPQEEVIEVSTTTPDTTEEAVDEVTTDLDNEPQMTLPNEQVTSPVVNDKTPEATPIEQTLPPTDTVTQPALDTNESADLATNDEPTEEQIELDNFEISCEATEKTITVGDDVEIELILDGDIQAYTVEWDNRFLIIGNDTKTGLFEIDEIGEKKIWVKVTRKSDNTTKNATCEISVEPEPEPEPEISYASEVRLLDKAPDDYKMYVNDKLILHQSLFEVIDGSAWLKGGLEITNEDGAIVESSPLKIQLTYSTQQQDGYYLLEGDSRGNVKTPSVDFNSLGFYEVVIVVEAVEEIGGNSVDVTGSPVQFTIEVIEKPEDD